MDEAVLGTVAGPRGSGSQTSGNGSGTSELGRSPRGRRRGRVTAMGLVAVLIAALCPIVAAPTAAADGGEPSIVALPAEFQPFKLNDAGQVGGYVFDEGLRPAVYTDGQVQVLPGAPIASTFNLLDISEAGEILVSNTSNQLEVRSTSGVRTLAKPVVGGRERNVPRGFGPDLAGDVVGVFGFNNDPESSSVRYRGASPPSLITELATVLGGERRRADHRPAARS